MTSYQKRGIFWCMSGTILCMVGLGMLGAAVVLAQGGDFFLIFLACCSMARQINATGDKIGWKPK